MSEAQQDESGAYTRDMRVSGVPFPDHCGRPLCAGVPAASLSSSVLRWPPILCSKSSQYIKPSDIPETTNPLNNLLDSLLVAFHFQECLDLAEGEVLPVPESHQLIKGAQQLKGIPHNLTLIQTLANACSDLCE